MARKSWLLRINSTTKVAHNFAHADHPLTRSGRMVAHAMREDFLRALQAFGLAAPPMQGCVGVVEPLDAAPRKRSDFNRFAGHLCIQIF
jgi:hypothetical protein